MTFRTQIWLKKALTLDQVMEIDAGFRELGLTVDPVVMKQDVAEQIVRYPTRPFNVDYLMQQTKSALVRDTLQAWRDEFLASVDNYVNYAWAILVKPANLIVTLPKDEWRQAQDPYEIRVWTSYDNGFPSLLGVGSLSMLDLPIVDGAIAAFGWMPISLITLYADCPDMLFCGYLAWHILDIVGDALLHPTIRSCETSTLAQLHPLVERGEFPGKLFAIPHATHLIYGPKTSYDLFMDADFLAAWLEHPDFDHI